MKRNKRPKHLDCISSVFPLFYKECAFCDTEFKLERGWAYKASTVTGEKWKGYVCSSCGTSKQVVYDKLGNKYGYRYPLIKGA